jgi:hypothetical protein
MFLTLNWFDILLVDTNSDDRIIIMSGPENSHLSTKLFSRDDDLPTYMVHAAENLAVGKHKRAS